MKHLAIVTIAASFLSACGSSSPTAPAPTPPPPPVAATVVSLAVAGASCANGATCQVPSTLTLTATASFSDGTTQNVTGQATWSSTNPSVASVSAGVVTARATGGTDVTAVFQGKLGGVTVSVPPPFSQSGVGDNVFAIPSFVTRVRVDATYGGTCQNFIVRISTQPTSLINVIIGTCSVADTRSPFSGTYAINNGGTVTITNSTGVNWTFTQLR